MGMKRHVTVGDKYCLQKVTAPVEYTVCMLMKTFQYRLYPTKGQQRLLTQQLEECRWLWNTLLAERKTGMGRTSPCGGLLRAEG
jgi:hypothetical protein